MSDAYKELLIKQERPGSEKVVGIVMVVLAVLSLISAIFTSPLFFIGVALFAVLSYVLYFRKMKVEFEFTYMDKELRVDRILNETKRKRVETFDMNKAEIIAPEKSYHLDNYKGRNCTVLDYSTHLEDTEELQNYVMYYEGKEKVFLSINKDFAKAMQMKMPQKVRLD